MKRQELSKRADASIVARIAVAQHPKLHPRLIEHRGEPRQCSAFARGEHRENRDSQPFADRMQHWRKRIEANASSGIGEMRLAPASDCEVRQALIEAKPWLLGECRDRRGRLLSWGAIDGVADLADLSANQILRRCSAGAQSEIGFTAREIDCATRYVNFHLDLRMHREKLLQHSRQ